MSLRDEVAEAMCDDFGTGPRPCGECRANAREALAVVRRGVEAVRDGPQGAPDAWRHAVDHVLTMLDEDAP